MIQKLRLRTRRWMRRLPPRITIGVLECLPAGREGADAGGGLLVAHRDLAGVHEAAGTESWFYSVLVGRCVDLVEQDGDRALEVQFLAGDHVTDGVAVAFARKGREDGFAAVGETVVTTNHA